MQNFQDADVTIFGSHTPTPNQRDIGTYVGDLILTFGMKATQFTGRVPFTWNYVAHDASWQLHEQARGGNWQGYPLLAMEIGEWSIWLMGELYETQSLESKLAAFLTGDINEANLNGHFLLYGWHSQSRLWHIWTNRFGTLHAYYADDGKRRALGTFFPAVASAASLRRLNWQGLAGFFAFGFFPSDHTHFEDVRILRPAHHYVFDEEGVLLHQERYWRWQHKPEPERSYAETVDAFGHLFNEVMAEHLQGRVALPISGGLDSRSTVAPVAQSPVPSPQSPVPDLWSYSYGYTDNSVETRIARQVAAARGLPFQSFTIQPYLFEKLPQILAWTEGFQDLTQCRQVAVVDEIGQHADFLIAALWGDVWLDDMGLVNGDGQRRWGQRTTDDHFIIEHALRKMEKGGRHWLLDYLVRPQMPGVDLDAFLYGAVADEMAPLAHIADPDFRVKAYKTDQWSFRWSLPPVRVFQAAAWPRPIFYDTRLADFFCTVPSSFVQGRRLQIDYLKRFAPDLARITWQAHDANLYHYQHADTWLLPKRVLKKAWRLLTRQQVIARNWEVQFAGVHGRQGLAHWLLRPGLRLHEFVSPQTVDDLLQRFYVQPLAPTKPGYTVSMLLTFSAWLEQYG